MRLSPSFNGLQSKNNFTIASSLDSEFTPIIVLQSIEYHHPARTKSFYVYKKPRVGFNNDMEINTYNSFNDCIQESQRVSTYNFKDSKGLILAIFKVGKHYITDKDDRILLTLCTREDNVKYYHEYSNSNDVENIAHDEGLKELVLLVSTELLSKPEYQTFWKKFEKDYIQDCYKSGIEVRFTTCEKIEKLCFSNSFKVEYQNVEQLLYHMRNVIPLLATKRGDEAFETIHGSLYSSFVPAEGYLYDISEKYRVQEIITRKREKQTSYERQLDELLDREVNESQRRQEEIQHLQDALDTQSNQTIRIDSDGSPITFSGQLSSNPDMRAISYSIGGAISSDSNVQFTDVQLIDDVSPRDELGLTDEERPQVMHNHILNMQEMIDYEEFPSAADGSYYHSNDVATGTSMFIGATSNLLHLYSNSDENLESFDESDDLPFD